jgi:hypothetical protein
VNIYELFCAAQETNLPVRSRKDALRMLKWYALRWNIETFHKILKSDCKAEDSKFGTAERFLDDTDQPYFTWRTAHHSFHGH